MSHEVTISPGIVLNVLTDTDAEQVIQDWLSIYAKQRTGCRIKDYKWHLFSGGYYESIEGGEALAEYSSQISEKYLVIDNNESIVFTTDKKPDAVGLSDYYVCPQNMAWTMAFTHEDGWLGPYFARHPNYQALDLENLAYIDKLKQIEYAKIKGWC